MTLKHAFEVVDRLLRDFGSVSQPFGGKCVIVSVDFRQIPSVVRYESRTSIVENLVKFSDLWNNLKQMTFTENLRVCDGDDVF